MLEFPAKGERYEGDFFEGMKQGIGKFFFAYGDVYEGYFKNDVRHGQGRLIFAKINEGSEKQTVYDGL